MEKNALLNHEIVMASSDKTTNYMRGNRVEGISDSDYQNARPYVEAAQAFAQTTYQSHHIINYYKKNLNILILTK